MRNSNNAVKPLPELRVTLLAMAICVVPLRMPNGGAQPARAKSYEAASVPAAAGSQCKLHESGTAASTGLPVFADDDGYARFYAVRATAGDAVESLILDCIDSSGRSNTYPVDLTSEATFAPRPLNLASERGQDRPALSGDPLSYSEEELIQAGYGLRPDPLKDAAAYRLWLEAAMKPGRMLEAKRPDPLEHTVISFTAPWWVGSVLTGEPNYVSTAAVFNVPKAIPGGDGTTTTAIALWNGLGGFGTGSGLIQGGVGLQTTPHAAV